MKTWILHLGLGTAFASSALTVTQFTPFWLSIFKLLYGTAEILFAAYLIDKEK